MKIRDILSRIDHTQLRPNATLEDYAKLAEEAEEYDAASVCVPPNRVKFMRDLLPGGMHVGTVVGFPNGYNTLETKTWEAQQAILLGADEIDMVIDIGAAVHSGQIGRDFDVVKREIEAIRKICEGGIILKVIVETCYLNEAQKINLCHIVTDAGANYIKTSTGFGPKGATLEDVRLFRSYLGKGVKIKAAGGISTIEQAKEFLDAGCERIGSSKLVRLLAEVEGDEV